MWYNRNENRDVKNSVGAWGPAAVTRETEIKPYVLMVYSYFCMQGMGNTEAKSNCEKWSFADEIPIVTGRRKWKYSLREIPSIKVTQISQKIKTHWEPISIIKDTFLATTPEEHKEMMSYGALKFLNTNICNRHVIIIKDIW